MLKKIIELCEVNDSIGGTQKEIEEFVKKWTNDQIGIYRKGTKDGTGEYEVGDDFEYVYVGWTDDVKNEYNEKVKKEGNLSRKEDQGIMWRDMAKDLIVEMNKEFNLKYKIDNFDRYGFVISM